jgi:hypothetical protein
LEDAWKARCRDIAEMMYARLPRELRNIIYTYACVEDTPLWIGNLADERSLPREREKFHSDWYNAHPDDTNQTFEEPFRTGPSEDFPDYDYPVLLVAKFPNEERDAVWSKWVLQEDYVGRQIAEEAVETYYSQNNFLVAFDKDLLDFLTLDLLHLSHLGVYPEEHIRNITVAIRCEPYSKLVEPEREESFLRTKMKRLLHGFHTVKDKAKLNVALTVYTEYPWGRDEKQRVVFNIIEALWKPYMALKEAGATVTVRHDSHWAHCDGDDFDNVLYLFPTTCMEVRKVSMCISSTVLMLTIVAHQDLVERPFDTNTLPMHVSRNEMVAMGPTEFQHGSEIRWGVSEFMEREETTISKMRLAIAAEFEDTSAGIDNYPQYQDMDLDRYASEDDYE